MEETTMNYLARNNQTWRPLEELRREMDKLFDEFWSVPVNSHQLSQMKAAWTPASDVEEADNHYVISLEMAGVPKDQIKVEFQNNQLTVSGERRHETKRKEEGHWYSERRFGKFQRTFTLPTGVNEEKVEAHYEDGILRVYVPKAESSKPRQITITSGSGTGFFGKLLGSAKKEHEGVN
jgi:HSP20 family protein